jgi:hypothetical protein
MNLICTSIGFMHCQLVELPNDVVSCPRVGVPGVVSARSRGGSSSIERFKDIVFIEAMPAVVSRMANLKTDLTLRSRVVVGGARGSVVAVGETPLLRATTVTPQPWPGPPIPQPPEYPRPREAAIANEEPLDGLCAWRFVCCSKLRS